MRRFWVPAGLLMLLVIGLHSLGDHPDPPPSASSAGPSDLAVQPRARPLVQPQRSGPAPRSSLEEAPLPELPDPEGEGAADTAWTQGLTDAEAMGLYLQALASEQEGDEDGACALYEQLVEQEPDHPMALIALQKLARIDRQRGELERAVESMRLAVEWAQQEAQANDILRAAMREELAGMEAELTGME